MLDAAGGDLLFRFYPDNGILLNLSITSEVIFFRGFLLYGLILSMN